MKTIRLLWAAAAAVALTLASASVSLTTPAFAQGAQDDKIATKNGDLIIHPVHHAGIVFTWNGKRIVTDPTAYPPGPKSAAADFKGDAPPDVILLTHEHPDHFSVPTLLDLVGPKTIIVAPKNVADMLPESLKGQAKVMKNGETATVNGVTIDAVAQYNITPDRLKYHPKGQGNGYVLNLGGKRIYIAGDTEETPELKVLKNIDVAFIPINLPYTETAEAAAQWVKDFKPKIVYPYHTQGMPSGDVKKFAELVGKDSDVRLREWYPK